MSANLLATKLHRPAPPPRLVQRLHLFQKLNEGLEAGCQLTLISAPAGFGKSTCVSEWVGGLNWPAAWLSLDPSDDDPARFFTYFLAALQKMDATIGREIAPLGEDVFQVGQLPPVEILVATLLNDLQQMSHSGFLILDDFQVIKESSILKAIELLLINQPGNLHLVLISREDPQLPLARLRANNRLMEIRAADLRFTSSEADCFLNSMMGLSLSEKDISLLAERTEGWVVGLQLAGLSMRGRSDPADFIARLSGSHRYILSYLTEEVLNRQPEDIQNFLLQTSILGRLSGDLCDAVTGRSDSADLLEQLLSANLFLIPLDDEQRWYRYHHLFADLLVSRQKIMQGQQTAELHRRAGGWFAQACEKAAFTERAALASQAVEHALAAADYPMAVQLIETHVNEIMNQWYARTVSAWMQALPPKWSAQSPKINLAFARLYLMQGQVTLAAPYLDRLQALFSRSQADEGDSSIFPARYRAEWLALQSTVTCAQGKMLEALELAKQALETAPENELDTLGQVYLALTVAYQQLDDIPHATDAYQKLIQLGQQSGNIITELLGFSALSLMVIQRGQLRYGFELASHGAARAEQLGVVSPICAGIYGELGQVHFHWCNFDQVENYLQRSAQLSGMGSFSDAAVFYAVARSRLFQMRGDWDAAAREIQKAADFTRTDTPVVVREEVVAQQVNVYLAQNNLAAAEQALFQATYSLAGQRAWPALTEGQAIPYTQGVLYISALRILLYRARNGSTGLPHADGAPEGTGFAEQLLAALLQRHYVSLALETLLLRAQLHAVLGHSQASQADYIAALEMAEPEGYISQFVMEGQPAAEALALLNDSQPGSERAAFIQRILNAFPPAQRLEPANHTVPSALSAASALPEALTARELEVLRWMADGLTYEDIAGKLVVSINTVRTHVKSIYGKLGVNNRTAAIEKTRQLSLL